MNNVKKPMKYCIAIGVAALLRVLCLVFAVWIFLSSPLGLFEDTNPYSVTTPLPEGQEHTLEHEGVVYTRNPNVHGVLLLGLQQQAYENSMVGPQADTVILLTINEETHDIYLYSIPRDLPCTVFTQDASGGIGFVDVGPLCNVYAVGGNPVIEDRPLDAGRFTTASLSHELFETEIVRFAGLDMDLIHILVDYMGGIEVPLTPEFAALTGTPPEQETVRIGGESAELYLRYRGESLEDGANLERMQRQQAFLSIFIEKIIYESLRDPQFAADIIEITEKFLITDMNLREMLHIGYKFITAESIDFTSMQGEMQGVEFHMDEAATEEYIRNLYYEPMP